MSAVSLTTQYEDNNYKTYQNNKQEEDFRHGDLGLGKGLKPGSLALLSPGSNIHDNDDGIESIDTRQLDCKLIDFPKLKPRRQSSIARSRTESVSSSSESDSDFSIIESNGLESKPSKLSQFFNRRYSKSHSALALNGVTAESDEQFPSYANVPYGTSIQQQKRLFERDLEKIVNKNMPCDEVCVDSQCSDCSAQHIKSPFSIEIESRLHKAQLEINELHIELENCRTRLESKYQAIEILRRQVEYCEDEYEENEQKAHDYSNQLEKEINTLQFSLHHKESMLESSEEVWTERFDRATNKGRRDRGCMGRHERGCGESASHTIGKRGLKRERDELLALVDVQDKSAYERSKSTSSDDAYNSCTSTELAVLGACTCRGSLPDPCQCAHAAAKLKRTINRLTDKLAIEKERYAESEQTIEAYREAFDQQLERNRALTLKVAEVAAPINRTFDKTKHLIKWVMRSMHEQDMQIGEGYSLNSLLIADIDTTKFSDRQLLLLVIDMLNERTTLRAHQKLAASILNKTCDLTPRDPVRRSTSKHVTLHHVTQ